MSVGYLDSIDVHGWEESEAPRLELGASNLCCVGLVGLEVGKLELFVCSFLQISGARDWLLPCFVSVSNVYSFRRIQKTSISIYHFFFVKFFDESRGEFPILLSHTLQAHQPHHACFCGPKAVMSLSYKFVGKPAIHPMVAPPVKSVRLPDQRV